LENTGPSGWRHQHVADRAFYAGERAVRAEREVLSDTEDAFARLNPDFGVLPDARDAGQHAFAQQREAALALGTRAAVAVMDEAHPDREQRQAAITARARTAARPGRGDRLCQARQDRPQSPAAPRRAERLEPLAAGCAEREDLAGFTQPVAAAVLAGGPELTALFSEKGTGDSWIPVRELARGEGGKAVGLATSFTSTMVDVATPKQLKASLQGLLPASVTLSSGPAQAWSVGSSATGSGAT
jgi:hypothetical protein